MSTDGKSCSINSCINSLHPQVNRDMYSAIADAFVVALPLFEAVLNFIGTEKPAFTWPPRVQPHGIPLRVPNEVVWL